MEYIKLIAIKVDDFCSSIFFEDNYALKDLETAKKDKQHLEEKGYICVLANTTSGLHIQ